MGLFTRAPERRGAWPSDPAAWEPMLPPRITPRRTAGVLVNFDTSLTISSVWAAATLRARLVSTLPLRAYRSLTPTGDPTLAPGGSIATAPLALPPVLMDPEGFGFGLEQYLYATQISLDLRGNAFSEILDRSGNGWPSVVRMHHPDRVQLMSDSANGWYYIAQGRRIERIDMIHERYRVAPGQVSGMSAIAYGATALGVNLAAEQFGADYFADGNVPTGILTADGEIDQATAKTIKERFMSAIRGSREPAVLGAGISYQQISVNPNEAQFLETMRFGIDKVAQFFELPATLIGGSRGDSLTYSNVEQDSIQFLKFYFNPLLVLRERFLSRKFMPRPQAVEFDRAGILQGDLLTRLKADSLAVANHTFTPTELRARDGLAPLTPEQIAELPSWGAATPPPEKP